MRREGDGDKGKAKHFAKRKWQGLAPALLSAVIVMMAVLGAGIMLYPSFADIYNRTHASETITGYNKAVEQQTRERREEIWNNAQAYNEALAADTIAQGGTINFWNIPEERQAQYEDALKVEGEGLMGYVSIPKVNVYLPIGHGIDEKVLQMGAGHLEGSSLPVGGASTHCVITGHTGLPSAKLFTDIDRLEEGDTFQLVVLNQTLTYEVSSIQVILPTEVDSLKIEEGQDLCTLLTCTPYGINDHRLLVTGRRIENPQEEQTPQNNGLTPGVVILIASVLAVVVGIVIGVASNKGGGQAKTADGPKE